MVSDQGRRVIFHIRIDRFFGQVEERENPSRASKPLVVFSSSEAIVIGTNEMAFKLGARPGMLLSRAQEILKDADAHFASSEEEVYTRISNRVMDILRPYADRFQVVNVDEAFLDVTERVMGDFSVAGELAKRIKNQVRATEHLTCSVGVGPNKLIAKLASESQKPYGLTIVTPELQRNFLFSIPVGKLFLVGSKTEEKLNEMGIKTIEELRAMSLEVLVNEFSEKLGEYLYRASRGIDNAPVLQR